MIIIVIVDYDDDDDQDQFCFRGVFISHSYDCDYNRVIGFLVLMNADSKKKLSRRPSSSDHNYSDDEDSGLCKKMF
jgi:hypothetical protein